MAIIKDDALFVERIVKALETIAYEMQDLKHAVALMTWQGASPNGTDAVSKSRVKEQVRTALAPIVEDVIITEP